jgi:hypothetical protein
MKKRQQDSAIKIGGAIQVQAKRQKQKHAKDKKPVLSFENADDGNNQGKNRTWKTKQPNDQKVHYLNLSTFKLSNPQTF